MRDANIPNYNPLLGGIQAGLPVNAEDHQNNLNSIEDTVDAISGYVKSDELSLSGIERETFVKTFNDALVSAGTNSIAIGAGATRLTTVDELTGETSDVIGWGASGNLDVTSLESGVVWAVTDFTYVVNAGERPLNGYRVLTFTNTGGVVTVNKKSWENCIESQELIFEENVQFNQDVNIKGDVTFDGTISVSTSPALPASYQNINLSYVSKTQIKILTGSECRDVTNKHDIKVNQDIIIDISN